MNTRQIGIRYEKKAAEYLMQRGYRIVEKNYRCRLGEIDLVGIEQDYLCFIEVKFRKNSRMGNPLEAIDLNKQRRIIKTAQFYILTHGVPQNIKCRFDAVGILDEKITLVKNAFGSVR